MASRKAKATKKNAKIDRKKREAKEAPPKLTAGANRSRVAELTHRLVADLERIEAQEKLLRDQKKDRVRKYKTDTGRDMGAVRDALALMKLDPVARKARLADKLGVLEDMGVAVDLPLFMSANQDAQLAADITKERAVPGFIFSLGQQAFIDKQDFSAHGYPDHAVEQIDKWQQGFLAEQKKKEEAEWAAKERKTAAPAGEDSSGAGSSE